MKTRPWSRCISALALSVLLVAGLPGCGGDDDDSPTGPGGGNQNPPADDFDQFTAQQQAQVALPQAVSLVESMLVLAGGITAKDGDYSYNEEAGRWEWHWVYDEADYVYDWFYTVQYLDENGQPQPGAAGASSFRHTMEGTADYDVTEDDYHLVYSYSYNYDTTISDLGSDALTMTGGGGYDFDYRYTGNGVDYDYSYVIAWETVGDGIVYPAGGCPSGTIRYTFAPYTMDIVFDGTAVAHASMTDAAGSDVPVDPPTRPVSCAP